MAKQARLPYRLFKRGDVFHAYFSFKTEKGNRVQFRESTGAYNEDDATRYCIKRISEFKEQEEGGLNEITIDEAIGRYAIEVIRYSNDPRKELRRYSQLLKFFEKDKKLSEITKNDILEYINFKQKENASNATINRYLCALSAIINRAKDYWNVNAPNFKVLRFKLKEPAENIKYLKDFDEVQKIINNAAPHLKPIIYTAIYTGLRLGNILNLKWSDIDRKNNLINIKVKDSTKFGGKILSVPVIDKLMTIFDNIEKKSEYIFTYRGKPIKSIKSSWKNCFTDDMEYVNFHTLRHTAATWILKKTGNLKVTKEILGHADIKTTLKYAHILDDEKRQALNDVFD